MKSLRISVLQSLLCAMLLAAFAFASGDSQATLQKLSPLLREISAVKNPVALGQADAAALIVKANEANSLLVQLLEADPKAADYCKANSAKLLALRVALKDPTSIAAAELDLKSSDPSRLSSAQATQLHARWIAAEGDDVARASILDEAAAMAIANPANNALSDALTSMQERTKTTTLRTRIKSIIKESLVQTDRAKAIIEQEAGAKRFASLVGSPLVLSGATPDGKTFSTEQWKGKVVLVDFWATWCGPCMAEMPRVKQVYAEFHPQGLEMLGVSSDQDLDALKQHLAGDPDMPWPQLFDATKPGWHALNKELGIGGIPTMFLIDKKGIVRSVTARGDMETQIPKLLAE